MVLQLCGEYVVALPTGRQAFFMKLYSFIWIGFFVDGYWRTKAHIPACRPAFTH